MITTYLAVDRIQSLGLHWSCWIRKRFRWRTKVASSPSKTAFKTLVTSDFWYVLIKGTTVNIPTLTLFVILRNRLTSKFVLHYYFTILIPFHYVVLWGKLMNLWREYASVKSMHTLILIWKSRCLWWWAFPRNRRRYTNLFIYAFTYAFIHLSSHLLMHLFMHLFCIYLFFHKYIVEFFFLFLIFFESNFI